eukprot:TRINITY_DN6156_c0_g2_i1.p1 TRINITY_DN6156_c0_g2~~TRINITY_DN6156_c0_g2_i1.p1  ORF type:complete len:1221 (+),score=226.86 TRINITY_DN6156_c0_g2_i1:141-3803(+)
MKPLPVAWGASSSGGSMASTAQKFSVEALGGGGGGGGNRTVHAPEAQGDSPAGLEVLADSLDARHGRAMMRRVRNPPRFLWWIVERPYLVMCGSCGLACIVSVGLAVGVVTGALSMSIDTAATSFKVTNHPVADRSEIIQFRLVAAFTTGESPGKANRQDGAAEQNVSDILLLPERSVQLRSKLRCIYRAAEDADGRPGTDNILTHRGLSLMYKFEQTLLSTAFGERYCFRKARWHKFLPLDKNSCRGHDQIALSPTTLAFGQLSKGITSALPGGCCACNASGEPNCFPSAGNYMALTADEAQALGFDDASTVGPGFCYPFSDETGAADVYMPGISPCNQWDSPLCDEAAMDLYRSEGQSKTILPDDELQRLWKALGRGIDCKSAVAYWRRQLHRDFSEEKPVSPVALMHIQYEQFVETPEAIMTDHKAYLDFMNRGSEEWYHGPWTDFVVEDIPKIVQAFNEEHRDELYVACFAGPLLDATVLQGVLSGGVCVGLAMTFVYLYMTFHLGSPVLALLGFTHILLSFPTTWFVYRVILGIEYMGMLNFIAMFVILGIGADDIFVFMDAFHQAGLEPEEISGSLLRRMTFAWTRAASCMLITSITDAAAFFANCLQIMPVLRLFGVYMGLIVVVNYLLVITWFPAVVIVYMRCIGCDCLPAPLGTPLRDRLKALAKKCFQGAGGFLEGGGDRRLVERFFADVYAPRCLKQANIAAALAAMMLCWYAISLAFAFQMELSDVDFRADSFDSDTDLMRFLNGEQELYNEDGDGHVDFIWGLGSDGMEAVDRSQQDLTNPLDPPGLVYDKKWNPAKPANQELILDTCQRISQSSMTMQSVVLNRGGSHGNFGYGNVACFMEHLKLWREQMGLPFPVPEEEFLDVLKNFSSQPPAKDPSCWGTCQKYHETAQYFPKLHPQDQDMWMSVIRWSCPGLDSCAEVGQLPDYDHSKAELRLLIVKVTTSIRWMVSASKARPYFEEYESIMQRSNAENADQTMQGLQAHWKWAPMVTEDKMITTAIMGCGFSIAAAFFVLAFSTGNWILALLSMVSIAGIVCSCIGFIVMIGWRFGFNEAICVTICVGFSVDFVVHLAVGYSEASMKPALSSQYERIRCSLSELGISIFSAALTTCGASLFMLGSDLKPFRKMGIFIFYDILISILTSILFFAPACRLFGPLGGRGDLLPLLKFLRCRAGCLSKRASSTYAGVVQAQPAAASERTGPAPASE